MKNLKWLAGVIAGCTVFAGQWASAQDWPQWRGPNRDAKATGFNAPSAWPKELNKKWSQKVGNGVATPALVGDKLYVFTRQDDDEVIRCLDAATGKEVWQDKYAAQPARGPAGSFPGPRSSPTVADGKVLTLGVQGTLSCLDAVTGKLLWRKDDFKGSVPRFFTSSSPLVVDGLCIAQLGGQNNGVIAAYDLATGEEKWKQSGDVPAYASPVVMAVNGTKLIIAETEQKVLALVAADGKLAWETPWATERMAYNAATPIADGQTLIYGGGGRPEKAVKIEKEANGFTAKELWSNKDNSVQFNTPVVKNGVIFGISQQGKLFCINGETGKTGWSVALAPAGRGGQGGGGGGQPGGGAQPGGKGKGGRGGMGRGGMRGGGAGYGSVVDAGAVLVALTPSSELVVFEPNDKEFKQIAKYKVATTPTYAYPVLSGNRIFIKDQDSVTLWTVD